MIEAFKNYLAETNLSANTQSAYLISVKQYQTLLGKEVTKNKLKKYKLYLMELDLIEEEEKQLNDGKERPEKANDEDVEDLYSEMFHEA